MAEQQNMTWPLIGAQIMSTVLTAGGQFQRGNTARAVGQRTAQADQFQAAQLVQNAGQERAAGQVAAENQDLATSYIVSQAMARAAASGGGASDPTIVSNIAKIQAEGKYRSEVARYQGESRARTMDLQADALEFQAQNALDDSDTAKKASRFSGFSTVLSGVAKTMSGKYFTAV